MAAIIGFIIGYLISRFHCFIKQSKKGMQKGSKRPFKFWWYWLLCHASYSCRNYQWGWNYYYRFLKMITKTGFDLDGKKIKK